MLLILQHLIDMKFISLLVIAATLLFSCTQHSNAPAPALKTVNTAWLDSIIKNSDSSYTKPYKRSDFVTAAFYLDKKDSSVCQVMKDSTGLIRQIIIARKGM